MSDPKQNKAQIENRQLAQFLAQIKEGLADADRSAVVTNEGVLRELREWQQTVAEQADVRERQ